MGMKKSLGRAAAMAAMVMTLAALSGCAQAGDPVQRLVEHYVTEDEAIVSDERYAEYEDLLSSGSLSEDGVITAPEEEEYREILSAAAGQVHVTFAANSFLTIQYYYDEALTEPVESDCITLDPGESVYCDTPLVDNAYSNSYVFSGFAIYAFDEEGKPEGLTGLGGSDNCVLTIPQDYTGTELSVMPLGEYLERRVRFKAFYYDAQGREHIAAGTWLVNGETCTGTTAEIGASESYTVVYEYDADTYYYVGATPKPFASGQAGEVKFSTASALDETETYTVQLQRYVTAVLEVGEKALKNLTVKVNGTETEDMTITKLTAGDVIDLTVKGSYNLYINGEEATASGKVSGGTCYSFTIPEKGDSDYVLSVTKKLYRVYFDSEDDYGTVTYLLNDEALAVSSRDLVDILAEDELKLSYVLTDENYKIVRATDGIFGTIVDWGKNIFTPKKETVTIDFSGLSDRQTITRADYITVEKGE